ncbi:MAG: endonuclease V [Nitrospiraceae bacterium]|jgi:deoxyribonuclease V|nr:MAG: endonuclease V [Nitrospiraceae bacterium]
METWPRRREDARIIQEEIESRINLVPLRHEIRTVAGVDAAFVEDKTIAAISVFDYGSLECIGEYHHIQKTSFPYIPGYLSFREGPAILAAFRKMTSPPDLLLIDGQGIAHPRRAGIASHIGVLLNIPTIGCAKSRLVGESEKPALEKGAWSPLYYRDEVVGAVLVTRNGCKSLYISPGHLITLQEAIEVVLHLTPRFRLPEPIRAADSLAKRLKLTLKG